MEAIFWISFALLFYTYVGYPFSLMIIGCFRRKPVYRKRIHPKLSVIIAAHNEQAGVRLKLANTLSLHYPKDRLEIILVSDGSTDRTAEIASEFETAGVRCLVINEWVGKSIALNHAVRFAKGEILVFTDIGAIAEPNCLEELVSNFADPTVGCVSAENHVLAQGSGASEGTYMKYLMWLRRLESRIGSCTCVCGSFYAIRRELCPIFIPHAATDLLSVLETVKRGYRTISDPLAHANIGAVRTQREEFQRKFRTVLLGVACLPYMLPLLNPIRSGLFSLELLSHKILRWSGAVFLVSLLSANAFIYGISDLYKVALGIQLIFYTLAFLGAISEGLAAKLAIVRIPYFLIHTHFSALVACWKYARGERISVWQPSKRPLEGIST